MSSVLKLKNSFLAVSILLLLNLVSVSVVLNSLVINNSQEIYFPASAPAVQLDAKVRETFPTDQALILLLQGEGLWGEEVIRRLDSAVQELESHPLIERVITVTTVDHIAGTDDDFIVEPLVDTDFVDLSDEAGLLERVLGDRFAPGLVVSEGGDAIAVIVRPSALDSSLQRQDLLSDVITSIKSNGLFDYVSATAGHLFLDVSQLKATVQDTLVFVPLTTVVGLLLIWLLYKRLLAVVLVLVMVGTMVTMTVALLVLWGKPYTSVASIMPPFMSALTTALLIHIFNGLAQASRLGFQGQERVVWSFRRLRRPVFFTCLTTSVGLFSLMVNQIQPIQAFGVVTGIAVLLLYPVVMGLLPAIIVKWDKQDWPAMSQVSCWLDRWVLWLSRLAIRRAGWVLLITVVFLSVLTPFVFKVHAETDIYKFFKDDHPLNVSTRLIEEKLSGVTTLEVVFAAEKQDALKAPERLAEIKRFQEWLDSLPAVGRSFSMVDIIEEMNWAFHGEEDEYRRVPVDSMLLTQYLFIYSGKELFELVDEGFQKTRLTMNLNVSGANEIQGVIDEIETYLKQYPVADLEWQIVGFGRLFADQEELLVQGQANSLWVVLLFIFLVMCLLWRSLSDALLCMLPNVSPILIIFILMGALGIWLDMATAMIASVAIGVAVDDTIHIYHGYKERIRQGRGVVFSLLRTYSQAGRAVMATTLVLSVQMLLLASSQFIPTIEFGVLTAVGLITALVFDLLVLPALLVVLSQKAEARRARY